MRLQLNGAEVYRTFNTPVFKPGIYESTINKVEVLTDVKTNYGFKTCLEFEHSVDMGITSQIKRDRIIVSEAKDSACRKFFDSYYQGNIPENIDLNAFVGKTCLITIEHNTGSNGCTFANITERKFK